MSAPDASAIDTDPDDPPTTAVRELLDRFVSPDPRFGPLPIWWWSGARVTRERVRWQMEQLIAGGVRQAVVLCLAPTGPTFGALADDPAFLSPEWLQLFDDACADAEELGFTLWLYDQIGFSGANFQGSLVAAHPGFAGRALHRTEGEGSAVVLVPPSGHEALMAYAVLGSGQRVAVELSGGEARWSGEAARVVLVHAGTSGFDYFDEAACAALLDQVHGTLERAVGHRFGTSIGGFFQDEMPAMPTWGPDFATTFATRYGYDLVPQLWALWEPAQDAAAARVRHDYHEHRATLGRRGFFDQHDAWFAERGLDVRLRPGLPRPRGRSHRRRRHLRRLPAPAHRLRRSRQRPLGRREGAQLAGARRRPRAGVDRGVPLFGLGRHPRGDLRLARPVPAPRRQPVRPARRLLLDGRGLVGVGTAVDVLAPALLAVLSGARDGRGAAVLGAHRGRSRSATCCCSPPPPPSRPT